ncbi:NHL repeat-containing protein [Granulicella sp. S156]|uniref:NHL repeat-containing protein n=1 Tax=Granulicella sp. S156 TaxID=1747224 RepID=UPI00131E419D|nr:NHL repeat-containing protein [Granulicella sp. S156]
MTTKYQSLSFVAGLAGLASVLVLSGCSANFGDASNTSTATAMHIQGVVHGGQQSLNGAHVYMYAASTTGYGGSGIAASTTNAATSLLTSSPGVTTSDGTNFYVTTDVAGNFNIDGAFACTPGTQIYLYSTGGDPQLNGIGTTTGNNAGAGLLAVLGNCASATPSGAFPSVTFVTMNEESTVATAFALEGFATDPTHIGAPTSVAGHSLSATGLANAFTTALNLVNQASGLPNATLPLNSNASVPGFRINTIADILAVCVNSTGTASSGCATLFGDTHNRAGTAPTDTATAAINIAQNPGQNVQALLNTVPTVPPFSPTFSTGTDLAFGINFTGGGISTDVGIAIDASGNAWVPNPGTNSVTEISSAGAFLSGTTGYTGGGLDAPGWLAIDGSGNVWAANFSGNSVTKLSSTGAILSGTTGFTGGGLNKPGGIAVDGQGNVWVGNSAANSVTKLSSTGAPLSGTTGFTGGNLDPNILTIDGAGNAWVSNEGNNSVTKLSSTGAVLSGTTGYTGGGLSTPYDIRVDASGSAWIANARGTAVTKISNTGVVTSFTGGDISDPSGIAIDGDGNAWISNNASNVETELSNTGALLSGANGYNGGGSGAEEGTAIDGSGNLWVTHTGTAAVTEYIGLGAPVVTPLAAALPVTPTTDGSSNAGTRP